MTSAPPTTSEPVTTLLLESLPNTLELAVAAMAVSLLLAVPTGVASAVHRDTWIDRTSQLVALLGVSMPNFWLGYLLILVCSLWLGLTPAAGSGTLGHLILPAITLGTGLAAVVTRLVRTSMLEVLEAEYVRPHVRKAFASVWSSTNTRSETRSFRW